MENKTEELKIITKPIVDFLKENYNPHTTIVITNDYVKVLSDAMGVPIKND